MPACYCGDAALPEGGRGHGRGEARPTARDGRADEGDAGRRRCFGKGTIRADGRNIHDMYLFEVKKPAESKGPWDYYKLRRHASRRTRPSGRWTKAIARCNADLRERAADTSMTIFGVPGPGAVRPAAARADQRRVLRDALARPRRHLRPAQHHQLRPRRAVHDGRLRRVDAARICSASATGAR